VTASRVEAIFDVLGSTSLSEAQRARLLARAGPRVVAVAQDERSQTRNRELALERLAERLARALAVPRNRRATRPSAAERARRLAEKRKVARRKSERRPPPADGD
jgi:ribosome-associated protein